MSCHECSLRIRFEKKVLSRKGQHDLVSNIEFNESLFSEDELKTINRVCSIVQKKGKKYLFDKSHEEDSYKKCSNLETLNYDLAKTLKVS